MTATTPRPVDEADVEQVRVPPLGRRVHVPMVLAGLLLVVGCALAFGVLAQRLADLRPVLVLARPLDRGATLTDADLAISQVSADPAIRAVAPPDRGRLVGSTLRVALPGGALLTQELVAPGAVDLGPRARTVGLALEPGEFPVATLAPGDTVSVVATAGDGAVLTDDGVVLAVEPAIEGSATLLVSVVVDAGTAAPIAAAAAADQVRLVLHGAGR